MGADKALLELDGISLVERAVRKLGSVSTHVVVADGGRWTTGRAQSVPDGPAKGPAAGILGASIAFPGTALLVLACDLPRVPLGLLSSLATLPDCDLALPRWNDQLEPLCALYRSGALDALRAQIAHGVLAPHRIVERSDLRVAFLEGDLLRTHGDPSAVFTNLNEPDDLDRLRGRRGDDG